MAAKTLYDQCDHYLHETSIVIAALEYLHVQRSAALALHVEHGFNNEVRYCSTCGGTWPCATVRALT